MMYNLIINKLITLMSSNKDKLKNEKRNKCIDYLVQLDYTKKNDPIVNEYKTCLNNTSLFNIAILSIPVLSVNYGTYDTYNKCSFDVCIKYTDIYD